MVSTGALNHPLIIIIIASSNSINFSDPAERHTTLYFNTQDSVFPLSLRFIDTNLYGYPSPSFLCCLFLFHVCFVLFLPPNSSLTLLDWDCTVSKHRDRSNRLVATRQDNCCLTDVIFFYSPLRSSFINFYNTSLLQFFGFLLRVFVFRLILALVFCFRVSWP